MDYFRQVTFLSWKAVGLIWQITSQVLTRKFQIDWFKITILALARWLSWLAILLYIERFRVNPWSKSVWECRGRRRMYEWIDLSSLSFSPPTPFCSLSLNLIKTGLKISKWKQSWERLKLKLGEVLFFDGAYHKWLHFGFIVYF